MKFKVWPFILMIALMAFIVTPVFAQSEPPVPPVLTDVQLFVIASVASIIVWLLKLAKQDIHAGWLTFAVYGVSLALAYIFAPLALPAFPPFTDVTTFFPALLAWVGALLIPLSALAGFATLIYNVLLKAILNTYIKPLFNRFKK